MTQSPTRTENACLADALGSDPWTYTGRSAVEHAKRHLASLTPERRAQLLKEWNDD